MGTQLYKVQCLTPRGRYDVKIYPTFLHLHGRTFDFKLTYTSIIRLFLLPHKDHRQVFFVISVDPPIKQGQTRYPFVICLFDKDSLQDITLDMPEDELNEKYSGKLTRNMTGATFEVVSRLMKAVTGRKITVPGSYKSDQGNNCVSCSCKAQNGVLFPLERGFMYLHKPPIYIRFDEIDNVNFARASSKQKSFEFHIATKQGQSHIFGTIDRPEYGNLFDFVKEHGLKIRNIKGQEGKLAFDKGDSDEEEGDVDFYRNVITDDLEAAGIGSEESSTDEDFDPNAHDSDAKAGGDEEYDSDFADRSTDSEDRESGDGSGSEDEEKRLEKEKKKEKKRKGREEKPKKERKRKAEGDEKKPRKKKEKTGPKRATSAYFYFLAEEREKIKAENPDIKITEISKIAGQMWKECDADRKAKYDALAKTDKERYEREKREWIASGGAAAASSSKKAPSKKPKSDKSSKSQSPVRASPQKAAKSAEFVADDSSSSDED